LERRLTARGRAREAGKRGEILQGNSRIILLILPKESTWRKRVGSKIGISENEGNSRIILLRICILPKESTWRKRVGSKIGT
jgi:hypothetical protein